MNGNKGLNRELQLSRLVHSSPLGEVGVLVSPRVLRERGLGQIDLCFIRGGRIEVVEVKGYYGPSFSQRHRLNKTCRWLGHLLGLEVVFRIAHYRKEF